MEVTADYLFSTIPMLALFASGLLAFASLLAIIWRGYDMDIAREQLVIIGWSIELFTPFLPTLILFVLWTTYRRCPLSALQKLH